LIDVLLTYFTSPTFLSRPASPGRKKLKSLETSERFVKRRKAVVGMKDVEWNLVERGEEVERPGTVELLPEGTLSSTIEA
jgi:hypothetical protein